MLKIERQAKILQIIREQEYVQSSDLARIFDVNLATIRRDLKMLSEQGLIRQDHGGSSLVNLPGDMVEPSYETKVFVNHEAKEAIGKVAAGMVRDGDAIILDSGTTNAEIARALRSIRVKNLTIITCDLIVAKELGSEQNMNVILLGGQMRKGYYTTYGPYTEYILRNMRASKYFLGIDAANQDGITNIVLEEVPIKQLMIEISNRVIAVTDSTKFDRTAPHRICSWNSIHQVITDPCITQEYLNYFQTHNIPVHTSANCATQSL
jgi:DeoR/GlpR family transcriptional regulator of sugar metabolism